MFISEIFAQGFRCFEPASPLQLKLTPGLNILVGPNDAGKSAIIDAVRYALWTRGDDYLRPDELDFYVDAAGVRAAEFTITCTFDALTPDEESRFLEWCTNERGKLRLHICIRSTRRLSPGGGSIITTQHRAGKDGEGLPIDGEVREYLKATYLKPLRDAERELRAGRRSRLSRILGAMPQMGPESKPGAVGGKLTLLDTLKAADKDVRDNTAVRGIASNVNTDFLDKLSFADDPLVATLDLGAHGSFDQVLERFELYLNAKVGGGRVQRGLGYNNLLFMAAELLLLQSHPDQIPFLLIEEPEAHLHPQHQTLFMEVLSARTAVGAGEAQKQVQVLLTTHSPQLAAGADLETMTIMVGHQAFPLAAAYTRLDLSDYEFLRRFLDATKANLFFARALIVVEGDGENLLLPALAEKLGRPLSRHGVSIVNVGHRGLFRYSRILQRKAGPAVGIPVALIPDRDIPPKEAKALVGERKTEDELDADAISARMKTLRRDVGDPVDAFIADCWTLEFDLALQPLLAESVYQAVLLAKSTSRRPEWRKRIVETASEQLQQWKDDGLSDLEIAVKIYDPVFNANASKAEVAEELAAIIRARPETPAEMRDRLPPYLVRAIDFVTQPYEVGKPPFADVAEEDDLPELDPVAETL
ncbi:ATP-dependent nuclease [Rhizobium laguerreae]|uniref:ATP-dependent nuclease n=1 Tax=Rhizobium laguerreae TaxID=1076926 RepID=UPI001442548F|nr:AAA family ATPase [Rhizobium laguerreae]MBY3036969.1 AAA family ATPase [Rhizobium laguerreae]NKN10563.1 AAA family ATPase [Rhizobium laguerreae]